jgi:hypothetical protein
VRAASLISKIFYASLVMGTSALAEGQNGSALLGAPSQAVVSAAVISGAYARNAKLISTTIAKNTGVAKLLTAPQMALDAGTSVTCPSAPAGKCIIEAEVTVQAASTVADNEIRLCTTLDGAAINGKCLAAGTMLVNTHMTMSLPVAQYNVAVGTHTLRSFVQADADATLGYFYVKYNVYK